MNDQPTATTSSGADDTMKKRLTRIIISLVLGALTTVAVAWGCALLPDTRPQTSMLDVFYAFPDNKGGIFVTMDRRFGETRTDWLYAPFSDDESVRNIRTSERPAIRDDIESEEPDIVSKIQHGLPLRAFEHRIASPFGFHRSGRGSLVIKWLDGCSKAFPLRVRPMQFTFDAMFFAFLWCLCLWGTQRLRRAWRVALGRCPKCAYILAAGGGLESGCPECGWNQPMREGKE